MKKILLAIVISLLVGFAAASWIEMAVVTSASRQTVEDSVSPFDSRAPVEDRISALEQAVIQEQQARQLLEEEMLVLREELEQRVAMADEIVEPSLAARDERRELIRSRRFSGNAPEGRLDQLIEAGFPPDRAQWIVDREAKVQLKMLQARYEAMRESEQQGIFETGFSQDSVLRAEMDEAEYERYLTASGRPTAVGVGRVLANSPAETAGIRPGDQIVRYDGERVYSMMDVAGRIMEAEADGNVVVDIVRDGVPMQLVLPRGPLGVMGN